MEDYARDFVGVACRSATEKTCFMVFFWGGLAEPFKSLMPYWHPEELLEKYVNLALHLSGSAFRVELTAEPAPVREPTKSAPEPAPVREPTESASEPPPVRELTESIPEPALAGHQMSSYVIVCRCVGLRGSCYSGDTCTCCRFMYPIP